MTSLHHFLSFLKKRGHYLSEFLKDQTGEEKWWSALRILEPSLPQGFLHDGDIQSFPPPLHKNQCMVIIANHQSDLDATLMMALMHTGFLKRETNQSDPWKTIKPIAFTHQHFEDVPLIGVVVKENFITLRKDITDEEMKVKIEDRLAEGYNTFVLFPEGGIHSKENHVKAERFWNTSHNNSNESKEVNQSNPFNQSNPYPFKNVFAPRHKCWDVLLHTLGTRLEYLCDLTILYHHYEPWKTSWDYDHPYSISYACQHPQKSMVMTHTKIYQLPLKNRVKQVEKLRQPNTLLTLWKKKERRLQKMRQIETEIDEQEECDQEQIGTKI